MHFTKEQLERCAEANRMHDLEVRVQELQEQVKSMEADVAFLNALREAGVDNWEGYSHAQEFLNE